MVTQFGLNDKVGVMLIDDNTKSSGKTTDMVDTEVRKLLNESYERAKNILEMNRHELEMLANGLIEYETLSGSEIVSLLKGNKIDMKNRQEGPSRKLKEITKPLGK